MSFKIGAACVRVSTDDQTEYSPESQIKLIRDYAKREGYIIPDEYVFRDDGISGKYAAKRPAFRLMIATAKQAPPPFDTIFVWKFSRFARNQEESIVYKNLLRKNGVAVRSITEPSSDGPFSSLIERIIEWMDEFYIINLADEVRRGMTEKAGRGEAMGLAPFGYSVKDKTFVENENADIIRYIFREFAAGKGAMTLAVELNEMGVKTRRGNAPDNRWVHYILTNPVYIGKIRWSTNGPALYDRANYNGDNVLLVDGKHAPIIDQDTWAAVQKRIKEGHRELKYKRRGATVFMLKGLVRCGDCGATLTFLNSAEKSLQCHKYARGQCRVSHCISLSKLNAAVITELQRIADGAPVPFSPPTSQKARARPGREWEKLIGAEETRLKRARAALLDGLFSAEEFRAEKAEIENTLARLRAAQEAEAAASRPAPPPDPSAMRRKIVNVLDVITSTTASEEAKGDALRSIVDKIVFNRPGDTLDFYFLP